MVNGLSRVSTGNRRTLVRTFLSKRTSVTQRVPRPGPEGSRRRPMLAKNSALINSDLPRATSATKAIVMRWFSTARSAWSNAAAVLGGRKSCAARMPRTRLICASSPNRQDCKSARRSVRKLARDMEGGSRRMRYCTSRPISDSADRRRSSAGLAGWHEWVSCKHGRAGPRGRSTWWPTGSSRVNRLR